MTYTGNIASDSETTRVVKSNCHLISTDFTAHHAILDKSQTYIIEAPTNGYLHIIVSNNKTSCILPYFINQNSYIIHAGENIIHSIEIGDKLEWRNINNSIAFISFVHKDDIQILGKKFFNKDQKLKFGLPQKSDNRTILLYNQILDCNKKIDRLSHLKILSIAIELLIHQIEQLFIEDDNKQFMPHKELYEKILLTKKIIEKDLTKNYTIAELSKLVGTNEQYLKKYFKQYFGKTIMHYITDHKMNYAKELIMSGEYRISDVARLIGYKHSTHFTTAFKKHFGFIPNSLRY